MHIGNTVVLLKNMVKEAAQFAVSAYMFRSINSTRRIVCRVLVNFYLTIINILRVVS